MGYMTVVGVLNDYLRDIIDDPTDFVNAIVAEYNSGSGKFNKKSGVRVMKSQHADVPQVVVAWRNSTISLDPYDQNTERLIQENPEFVRDNLSAAREVLSRLEQRLDSGDTT